MTLITDPAAPVALFPGQGSQTPEMRDLVADRAPELLERCIALVGEDPFPRASESTRFAQPAIFCASLAGWDALDLDAARRRRATRSASWPRSPPPACSTREDALRARRAARQADGRGRQRRLDARADRRDRRGDRRRSPTPPASPSPTTTLPARSILSGPRDKLATAEEAAREYGRRVLPLDVAGAFHSPSMEPAVKPFRAALDETELHEPAFPVFSSADRRSRSTDVRAELTDVLTRPVRWRETVLAMHEAGGRALRRGRPRQGARPPRQAHPSGLPRRDPGRGACPCVAPRCRPTSPTIARDATRNGTYAKPPRRARRASSGSATTCRRRSSRTGRSPSASASTTPGSSSAPASSRAAARCRTSG